MDPEREYKLLDGTQLPMLLIWGQEDQTITADLIEILRSHSPDIEYVAVPEAGHIPHYEQQIWSIQSCWNF